uniref:Uncharacterized protein n=1 Tax=Oncorhynchus mykiss TaxID=8022 RepID=A0A8K9WZ49_ONCMY
MCGVEFIPPLCEYDCLFGTVSVKQCLAFSALYTTRMSDDDKNEVGGKYEIDPAIICGIISRVQRWESNTGQEWLGDHGMSFGLMLLQTGATTLKGEWGGQEHLKQGTQILINVIKKIKRKLDGYTTQDYSVMLPKLNTLHNGY